MLLVFSVVRNLKILIGNGDRDVKKLKRLVMLIILTICLFKILSLSEVFIAAKFLIFFFVFLCKNCLFIQRNLSFNHRVNNRHEWRMRLRKHKFLCEPSHREMFFIHWLNSSINTIISIWTLCLRSSHQETISHNTGVAFKGTWGITQRPDNR